MVIFINFIENGNIITFHVTSEIALITNKFKLVYKGNISVIITFNLRDLFNIFSKTSQTNLNLFFIHVILEAR